MSDGTAPPEITEGEIIARLVNVAGYIATECAVCKDDPRIKAVLDVALEQVTRANVLPDLLRLMHKQNTDQSRKPTASEVALMERERSRKEFEDQMKTNLIKRQEILAQRSRRRSEVEDLSIKVLRQQITQGAN